MARWTWSKKCSASKKPDTRSYAALLTRMAPSSACSTSRLCGAVRASLMMSSGIGCALSNHDVTDHRLGPLWAVLADERPPVWASEHAGDLSLRVVRGDPGGCGEGFPVVLEAAFGQPALRPLDAGLLAAPRQPL